MPPNAAPTTRDRAPYGLHIEMSLIDILKPPALPKRKGKVVRALDAAAEARKAATLSEYEERQRQAKAAARSARMKALNADPEFKAKMSKAASARMKALHADPEFKAKMKALHADPEFKAATAARMKALHADPEFRDKLHGGRRAQAKAARIARLKAALEPVTEPPMDCTSKGTK